jgi:uncharacterized protein YndB with AHSA1/START domain
MINVEASTLINRPVADVFAFVANFENHPKWESNFVQVKRLSSGAIGVGTTYLCVLQVPGQKTESNFEITEYVPNQKISFRGDRPAQAKPVGSMTFESVGNQTKVTAYPRPEMGGIFKLLEPLMAGFIKKQNETHLKNLKELLEAG